MSHLLYEGSTLERVLERVQLDHGDRARIVAADRGRRGGVAGFFTKEVFQVTVEVDDEDALSPAPVPTPDPAPLGRITPRRRVVGGGAVAEVLPRSAARRGEEFAASLTAALAAPEPLAACEPERPRVVSGLHRHDPPLPAGSPAGPGVDLDGGAWADIRLGRIDDPPRETAVDLSSAIGATVVQLQPHRVRRASASPAQLGGLLAEIDRDWQEPARLPSGGVVAVLGAPDDVRRVALDVARRLDVLPSDIVVASPNDPADVPTAAHLEAMSAALRAAPADRSCVVAIEALPGRLGHSWARVVLAGLAPDHVRFAASATRPVEAHVPAMTALGGAGAIDVVDLLDVDDNGEPEEFLGLGVPVATVDGRVATPVTWAALVLSARAREAMDDHDRQVIDQLVGTGR